MSTSHSLLDPTDANRSWLQVGLFTNVSSGIADVFYEPYKGVVMHGNSELGVGIAKVCSQNFGNNNWANDTGNRVQPVLSR